MKGRPRSGVVRALPMAVMVTLVIAVVAVVASAVLDAFVARRVLWEVDQRLQFTLTDAAPGSRPPVPPVDQGIDGAPVFLWWLPPEGRSSVLTSGAPPFPAGARGSVRTPLSVPTGGATFRFVATASGGGWLVAAQDLAGPSHIERVLLVGELLLGPVLLAAVFGGVLLICRRAVAPVEDARRRLLELTADASHELRTPLTVIGAEIELARSEPPSAADRVALEHVARESRRLETIVADLLWLARFDAAPPPPAGATVDLAGVVAGCADRFGVVAGGRGLSLSLALEPAWVDAAPDWLDRLTGTLLDNACRHAASTVRVSVRSTGARAVLLVEDDGPGIPPAARSTLFDRFRRATDEPGGAGLGLAIADSVVRSTGGRWRVGTSPFGGASMEVAWRRSQPPATVPPADITRPAAVATNRNGGAP